MDDIINSNLYSQPVHFFSEIGEFQGGQDFQIDKDRFIGGGGENPEPVHPPEEGFTNRISENSFQEVKSRTEKSARIAFDLSGQNGEPTRKAREEEIRALDDQGVTLDARGYDVFQFRQRYIDPSGKIIVEDCVGFTKVTPEGEVDYLRLADGRAAFINASLYNSRLESQDSASIGKIESIIPRIDGEGRYKGVVRLIEERAGQTQGAEKDATQEKEKKIKSFKTAKGSIYVYDEEGKTTRFKTVEGAQYDRQDLTVFVDLNPDQEQEFLRAYHHPTEDDKDSKVYVLERQQDDSPKILRDIVEVSDTDRVYLGLVKDGKLKVVKASIKPIIGYNTFDTRQFIGDDGKTYTERHLGNKVSEIEYEN